MPRPTNELRRLDIRGRRVELRLEHPLLTDTQLNQMVAVELGVSLQTVWYYLRAGKSSDSRVKYSAQEREKLCGMSRRQLLFYAAQNGKNFNTLYAMVRRHVRKGIGYQARIEDHVDFCEEQDFMDFSRLVDLKAFSFPGDAFKEARKAVQGINAMDLLPPNYLIHEPSKKFFALTLAEQKALLANPRRFLRENAGRISHNWKNYNPKGHYFVLVNTQHEDRHYEGMVVSTHDTLQLAAQAAKTVARSKVPVPTKILRRFGESKSPYMRFIEGERVPKGGPDAGGIEIYVDGGDILTQDLPQRGQGPAPRTVDLQEDEDEGDCGVADDEDEGDCGVEDDEETIL